jgi:hypothetical protein
MGVTVVRVLIFFRKKELDVDGHDVHQVDGQFELLGIEQVPIDDDRGKPASQRLQSTTNVMILACSVGGEMAPIAAHPKGVPNGTHHAPGWKAPSHFPSHPPTRQIRREATS